jgi:hypothetical protein
MEHHHHDHDHNHDHDHDYDDFDAESTFGLAIGFRIIEEEGDYFLAEAEVAPYVDEPDELGVTLVFHPLDGVNPAHAGEEVDWPSWPIDIDDDLDRNPKDSLEGQFAAIVRQLHDMKTDRLRAYLRQAREEAAESGLEG